MQILNLLIFIAYSAVTVVFITIVFVLTRNYWIFLASSPDLNDDPSAGVKKRLQLKRLKYIVVLSICGMFVFLLSFLFGYW
jgi:hypothetical protein